jgi:hypothetical protein
LNRSQEEPGQGGQEPGGARRRSREEQGGARKSQEEPGGARSRRRTHKEPGEPGDFRKGIYKRHSIQKIPGRARRKEPEERGARKKGPGQAAKMSTEIPGALGLGTPTISRSTYR